MTGLDAQDGSLSFNGKGMREKLKSVGRKLGYVEWVSVFKWKKVKEAFTGTET